MTTFKEFNNKIKNQFNAMCQTGKLFRANITGQQVWELYINSFKNEKIFRDPESSEHNCNCCKNFLRRYGNIVSINNDGCLESMFSHIGNVGEYTNSAEVVDKFVTSRGVKDVFFETYNELNNNLNYEKCSKGKKSFKLGIEMNYKQYTTDEINAYPKTVIKDKVYEFDHFCVDLPSQFVDFSGKSIEQITAFYRDKYSIFKRGVKEISLDTLHLVRDLITQGSLLDGTAHLHAVKAMIDSIESLGCDMTYYGDAIDIWFWQETYNMEERIAKFKNTLIGVLCTELAEGMELNKACLNWNKRVDPTNYHKATAPIPQRQINDAKKFVEENGYTESFDRRFATIDDIKASEIKHINTGNGDIKEASIFDNVKSTSTRHKRSEFDKLEEVSIEKFMKNILPSCTSVEAYLENRMQGNLVSMTTSNSDNCKQLFKWDNPYSWTFNGNLAGKSMIENAINNRGGKTDGVLNVRLHFPKSTTDYDLCISEPNGNRITYHSVRKTHKSSGRLDLDAQGVDGNYEPEDRVENINYTDLKMMPKGTYRVEIDNYGGGSDNGFIVEVKTLDSVSRFEYSMGVYGNGNRMFDIQFDGSDFTINNLNTNLKAKESETTPVKMWGLDTLNFHKVNLVCNSPNHWGDNNVGNLHYMFMLDNCKSDSPMRSFHNENLNEELLKYRKVMEVLGAANMLEPTSKQLSGLGFNGTVSDELIVRVQGSFKRMLKIKF